MQSAYEAKQRAGLMETAQGGAGQDNRAQNAPPACRPIGVLLSNVNRIGETLSRIEGARNRIFSFTERAMNPRPQDPSSMEKNGRDRSSTLEGELEELIGRAERLHASLDEIADRLDSAI